MRKPLILLTCAVAAPVAAQTIQPGLWETTTRITSMTMPNMPTGMTHPMANRAHSIRNCVRAEDVAKAPEKVFQASQGKCRYTSFKMDGGVVDAAMQCEGGMTGRSKGTFTPTSYAMTSEVAMTTGMKMSSSVTGRRVGNCK